jgi:hypothetical protein
MQKIYFTLEKAREVIPIIRLKVAKLIQLHKSLDILDSIEIEFEDEFKTTVQDIKLNKKFHELSLEFHTLMEDIHNIGCYVKDLDNGLFDFYSLYEGREILLCWKICEPTINYWHETYNGYEYRKPVSLLQSKNLLK